MGLLDRMNKLGQGDELGLFARMNKLEGKNAPGLVPQLVVKELSTRFRLDAALFGRSGRVVYALNGVSFTLFKGENYGLVGESGSGKTTLAKTLAGVFKASAGGWSFGEDGVSSQSGALLRYVFQDPASSLNPRMTVYELLTHGYRYYMKRKPKGQREDLSKKILWQRASEVLATVGIAQEALSRRSFDFSGGQRQRISLARALMYRPQILICDEVVSALDLSIQSQILNLLVQLRQEYQFSMLFIAHDLSVVSFICDRVGVMNGGFLVEEAEAGELFRNPLHPYTQLLYASMPVRGQSFGGTSSAVSGQVGGGSGVEQPVGCPFVERCPERLVHCGRQIPPMIEVKMGHKVACWAVMERGDE